MIFSGFFSNRLLGLKSGRYSEIGVSNDRTEKKAARAAKKSRKILT